VELFGFITKHFSLSPPVVTPTIPHVYTSSAVGQNLPLGPLKILMGFIKFFRIINGQYVFHLVEWYITRNFDQTKYLLDSELLNFWALSIVWNSDYKKTRRFGNWFCFHLQVREGDISITVVFSCI
jgi:hypothetical protein